MLIRKEVAVEAQDADRGRLTPKFRCFDVVSRLLNDRQDGWHTVCIGWYKRTNTLTGAVFAV